MSKTTETDHATLVGRATAVAREYDALMGLGYVSLGLGMVVGATMPGMAPIWIALGAAFCAMSAGWYHRHYGFVRARRDRASRLALGAVAAVLVILAGQVADQLVERQWSRSPCSASRWCWPSASASRCDASG